MSSITDYSFLFQSTSNTNNSPFFSNTSLLGDYSMIKSGVYKKLLTAYYDQTDTKETDSSDNSTKDVADSTEKAKLLNTKSDAATLKEAADALSASSLYRSTGKDEAGNAEYDREKITTAVKDYVSAYNEYLDSSSNVESTTVLNKTLSMVKKTARNENLLKEVGITVGADNKLVLDEEKLSKASVSTLSSLFSGNSSYGDEISEMASESYRLANSAAYTNNNASSYTYTGNYSSLGSTSNMLDTLL